MIMSTECFMRETCGKYKSNRCNCDGSFCLKLFKLDRMYNEALISPSQRKHVNFRLDSNRCDYDAFMKLSEIEAHIEDFVSGGKSLLLNSSICGNGKTAWSLRLIQSYFEAIWHKCDLSCQALFVNVPRLLLALKDNISDPSDYVKHIKDNILTAPLVVWDEVGVKALSEYEHEHLLNFINARIDMQKANIYTSNMNALQLKEKLGERLFSRVYNLSTIITLHGSDKRGIL